MVVLHLLFPLLLHFYTTYSGNFADSIESVFDAITVK